MPDYLLTAEVDKIQSFIFQSSRLREVVGGSYLLETFSKDLLIELKLTNHQILTASGGAFRFLYPTKDAAEDAGKLIKSKFEHYIGGTITISEPVLYNAQKSDIAAGNRALREAKTRGCDPAPLWHFPYHAMCESCGKALATGHKNPGNYVDSSAHYLCDICQSKTNVNAVQHLLTVINHMKRQIDSAQFADERAISAYEWVTSADNYGDERQYVAYLVADGNRMGEHFSNCSPNQLRLMSQNISTITREAMVEAANCLSDEDLPDSVFPVLPLISGGDDLFVLMPATWAISLAAHYIEGYEGKMSSYLRTLGVIDPEDKATTGAAVVICKASYPYKSAHAAAHHLLDRVKNESKDIGESLLAATLITGGTIASAPHAAFRPTAYSVKNAKTFLKARFELRQVPSSVLGRLNDSITAEASDEQIKEILDRIGRVDRTNKDLIHSVFDTMTDLRNVFPEIVQLWNFAYDANRSKVAYFTGEIK